MAEREAGIRVTLRQGGYVAGLNAMKAETKAFARASGNVISSGFGAGIKSAKGAFTNMFGAMTGHVKSLVALGSGIAILGMVKHAVALNSQFGNLAFQVNRVKGNAETAASLFRTFADAGNKSGQSVEDMAGAFKTVFSATGDLAYSKAALAGIGTIATATGEDVNVLANASQMLARKFKIGPEQASEALAQLVQKTGIGGPALEDLTARFGMMATEANEAGMTGTKGISQLLGMMVATDAEIGEKAPMAFKAFFAKLKDGTTSIKALEKASGIKFKVDDTAFDKFRKLMSTDKGRKALKATFKMDARILSDTLQKPFEEAYKAAKKAHKSEKEAVAAGTKAFDEAMKKMGESGKGFADMQKRAASKLESDPKYQLKVAMNKIQEAFMQPSMIKAFKKLGEVAPKVADAMAKLLDFAMNHPLLAAGGYMGAKFGVGMGSQMVGQGAATLGSAIMVRTVGSEATKAAFTAAIASGGAMAATAMKGGIIAAAAIAAFYIGKSIIDNAIEAKNLAENKGAMEQAVSGRIAEDKRKTIGQRQAALDEMKRSLAEQEGATQPGFWGGLAGGVGALVSGDPDVNDEHANMMAKKRAEIDAIEASIQADAQAQRAAQDGATAMSQMATEAGKAAKALARIKVPGTGGAPHGPPGRKDVRPGFEGAE